MLLRKKGVKHSGEQTATTMLYRDNVLKKSQEGKSCIFKTFLFWSRNFGSLMIPELFFKAEPNQEKKFVEELKEEYNVTTD